MPLALRPAEARDVERAGDVVFVAYYRAALEHGAPPARSSPAEARRWVAGLLGLDPQGGVVVEEEGELVGVGWAHRRGPVATVGPLAVEPRAQGRGVGRRLLAACVDAAGPGVTQVRLVHQSAQVRALALFLRGGFRVVAPLVELELAPGTAVAVPAPVVGVAVRDAEPDDRASIVARDARAFGAERPATLDAVIAHGRAVVASRGKTLVGYALGDDATNAEAAQLGTASADEPAVLLALLATLAGEFGAASPARPVRILVPATDRRLVDGLLEVGFRVRCAAQYLVRGGGTPPPASYVLMSADLM